MENDNLVDAEILAKFFDREVRTIQHWSQVEGMPKEDRNLYDFVKCVKWRLQRLEDKIEELEKGDETLYKLKQEYQRMMNIEKDLNIKKLAGDLVDYNQVRIVFTGMIKMLMTNLEALAPRINKQINGDGVTLHKIKAELNEFRQLCSETPLDLEDKELNDLIIEHEQNQDIIDQN